MRCVFLGQIPGQGISRHGAEEHRDEDQPAPPPQHCSVILEGQLSVFYHFSFVSPGSLCDLVISWQRGGDASSNRRRLDVAPSSSRTRPQCRSERWNLGVAQDNPRTHPRCARRAGCIAPCHTKCQKFDLKRSKRHRPRSACSHTPCRMTPATSATNPCSPPLQPRWPPLQPIHLHHR